MNQDTGYKRRGGETLFCPPVHVAMCISKLSWVPGETDLTSAMQIETKDMDK